MEEKMKEQVDFMVMRFQETMKKFDDFTLKMTDVLNFMKDIVLKVETLEKNVQNLSLSSSQNEKVCVDSVTGLFSDFVSHDQSLKRNNIQINDIQSKSYVLHNEIMEIKGQISQFSEKYNDFAGKDEINHVKNILKTILDCVNPQFQNLKVKNTDFSNSIDSLKSFTGSLATELLDHKKFTSKIEQSLDNLKNVHTVHQFEVESKIKTLGSEIFSYVDQKILSIPKPIIPSLDETKEHVNIKVEPALLDARNANIRSTNNEQKIFIMEKKIEQLQLLLNKMQIQG